jgi:DHA3 family macrolide efflux protein-like MFS transporter
LIQDDRLPAAQAPARAPLPCSLFGARAAGTSGMGLFLTRDFGLVWWGQMGSQVGDGVSKLALLWFVYSVTGSPLKTSVIGLLQTVPPILFGPLIGVWIDRLPKKALLIGADLLRAVLLGLIPCAISAESFTVQLLYLLVLLHALASAVFNPTLTAAVPSLVPRSQFTAANALLQSTTSLGIILGPALSGMGIAALSAQEVLCVNAATYLVSAACLLPVRLRGAAATVVRGPAATMYHDLRDAVRFVLIRQPVVLLLILIATCYTFGTSALTTLFPVFGRKMLDLGPVEVGYLWSALGVGLLLMSLALVRLTEWDQPARIRLIAASSAVTGLATAMLTLAHQRPAAACLMAVIGAGMGAMTPIAWGLLQELTPGDCVGRVLAIYNTVAMAAAIAGISAFGWLTEGFGEPVSVLGIGAVLLLTACVAVGVAWRVGARRLAGHPPLEV